MGLLPPSPSQPVLLQGPRVRPSKTQDKTLHNIWQPRGVSLLPILDLFIKGTQQLNIQ